MNGFLSGSRGGKSSTRLMTVSAYYTAMGITACHIVLLFLGKSSDLMAWAVAFLTFASTTQVGKSYIEEKYIQGDKK